MAYWPITIKKHSHYRAFEQCLKSLIDTIIGKAKITPQSITSRVKEREKLAEKIQKPGKEYTSLSDITDICGVRIITYFTDEVDKVAELIEKEFLIDRENSVDKRTYDNPDRFGYQSLHYIVSLKGQRTDLTEYANYKNLKAEIQIRTVIQHAWAEIEHDLGYKNSKSIPLLVRRRFYRLAAMLEVTDDEFVSIKNTISEYENRLPESINQKPEDVAIDMSSIKVFITTSSFFQETENEIFTNIKVTPSPTPDAAISYIPHLLNDVNIKTIGMLNNIYKKYNYNIKKVMINLLKTPIRLKIIEPRKLVKGLSLVYLCYVVLYFNDNHNNFIKFLRDHKICTSDEYRAQLISKITYQLEPNKT